MVNADKINSDPGAYKETQKGGGGTEERAIIEKIKPFVKSLT